MTKVTLKDLTPTRSTSRAVGSLDRGQYFRCSYLDETRVDGLCVVVSHGDGITIVVDIIDMVAYRMDQMVQVHGYRPASRVSIEWEEER